MDKITCPNCTHEFDVEQALSMKLETQLQRAFEKKVAEQAARFHEEKVKLAQAQAEFKQKKERENQIFKERLDKSLASERERIEQQVHQQAQQNFALKIQALEEDTQKKQAEIIQLRKLEVELLKRESDLREQADALEIKAQKQLLEQQQQIEENARAKEREANLLKEKEYQKKLDDQKKLIDEMKRKAEQGSIQMQGEVQELAVEELLTSNYPFDKISEVPKGIRGADCMQHVINARQQACGSIVYESKRTKKFSNDWIPKLKQDQVICKADIAVIVTETYPSGMDRFGEKEGVWICGFHELKSVSFVLREILLKTHAVKVLDQNKGDKMEALYRYLTSNEFVQKITRIIENYDVMTTQLSREKRAMERLWAERSKQIDVMQVNIASLFGSIKGIAGTELESVAALELPITLEEPF